METDLNVSINSIEDMMETINCFEQLDPHKVVEGEQKAHNQFSAKGKTKLAMINSCDIWDTNYYRLILRLTDLNNLQAQRDTLHFSKTPQGYHLAPFYNQQDRIIEKMNKCRPSSRKNKRNAVSQIRYNQLVSEFYSTGKIKPNKNYDNTFYEAMRALDEEGNYNSIIEIDHRKKIRRYFGSLKKEKKWEINSFQSANNKSNFASPIIPCSEARKTPFKLNSSDKLNFSKIARKKRKCSLNFERRMKSMDLKQKLEKNWDKNIKVLENIRLNSEVGKREKNSWLKFKSKEAAFLKETGGFSEPKKRSRLKLLSLQNKISKHDVTVDPERIKRLFPKGMVERLGMRQKLVAYSEVSFFQTKALAEKYSIAQNPYNKNKGGLKSLSEKVGLQSKLDKFLTGIQQNKKYEKINFLSSKNKLGDKNMMKGRNKARRAKFLCRFLNEKKLEVARIKDKN